MYTYDYGEKLENKDCKSEELNMKESWRFNVSVSLNHHQDLEMMLSSVVRSPINVIAFTSFNINFFTLDYLRGSLNKFPDFFFV